VAADVSHFYSTGLNHRRGSFKYQRPETKTSHDSVVLEVVPNKLLPPKIDKKTLRFKLGDSYLPPNETTACSNGGYGAFCCLNGADNRGCCLDEDTTVTNGYLPPVN
jgi:hypothetical protein